MSNIVNLALKVTGDATGLAKSLTPAERALDSLVKQAEKATAAFGPLAEKSGAAARAQEEFADKFSKLAEQLKSDVISPQEYAAAFGQLTAEAKEAAKAFAEGAAMTAKYNDEGGKLAAELDRINRLLEIGAITEETAAKARADASGETARLAEEEKLLADAREQAARIIEANLSALERAQKTYDEAVAVAQGLEERGLLTKEQLNAEIERQADLFARAAIAAGSLGDETAKAGEAAGEAGLKFNELSGFIGLLPGSIGQFASRLSSLASSAEGFGKIIANPSAAISGFATSLAGLATPAGLATLAISGLGAAAAGLKSLEGELESLTNTANKLGVSFQFVETLKQSSEMAGVSFGTVNTAMTRLLRTLAGADEESQKAAKSLEAVGLSFDDIKGKDSEQQIKIISERLSGIEDPAKRAAAATAIFGRAGAELLPAFENLAVGEKTLERFNARIADIDRNRVLALGDSFDAVAAATKGFSQEMLTPFIGITQSLSDGFASTIAVLGKNLGAVLDVFSPLASVVGGFANTILQLGATISNILGTVLEPFAAWGRTVSSIFDAQSRAITEVFGRVNDAINGFREFFKFTAAAEYMNTVFDSLWKTTERVLVIFSTAFSKIGAFAAEVFGTLAENVQTGVDAFLGFTGLGGTVAGFAEQAVAAFSGLWEGIKFVVGQVGGFIEQVLKFAEDWLGIVPKIEEPVKATVEVTNGGAIEELLAGSKEFQKTLDDITKGVSDAINESSKFGQAGFDAALKYQTAVDDLKKKLDAGLFNEETFRREAEKAGAAFKTELARLEEDAKLDIQIKDETEKTLAGLQERINKAVEGAQQFGQSGFDAAAQFQAKLRDLGAQFEDGRINAATLAQEVAKATSEYDKQIEGFKKIEELQKRTLENEKNRVAELLKAGDTTTQLERDIEVVDRERLRLEEEIRKQREAGNVIAADAATAKLAQLDQLQAKLDDQQQAVDQGFADGFTKAFEATNKSIDGLIGKAEQFGNVGALAAEALEQGIAKAQQQAQDGILTAETYQKEVERQQELFNQRLAAAQRVEDFLTSKLNDRQKAELEAVKKLEERKKQAAVNVQAIEAKIQTEQKAIEAARKSGNLADARAGATRLKQLQQAKRGEEQIANGREQANRQQAQQLQQGSSAAQQFQSLIARQNEAFLSGFQNAYAGANAALAQSARVAEEQARRMEALTRPTTASVNVADIRTAEGQALVQDVAAQAQDPALIEARLQTKLLNAIASGITGAASNYFNQPVAIVGAARL
jgi:phage-related protein